MQTIKKERKITKKEKSRSSDLFPETAALTPPRQHQKSNLSKRDASKKGTVHKRRRRPIMDLRFSPEESHCSQNNAFNKAKPWIFTLKDKTLDFSCAVAPTRRPFIEGYHSLH
jgi:hypothetical protein